MEVFMLIDLQENELVTRKHYADGKKAAKIAQRLTSLTKRKYQVRKVDPEAGDPNWRDREQARFDNEEYLPVIDFIKNLSPPDTFPHVAKKGPSLIAYTKDEFRGRTDKQSLLSIDAFIDLCLKCLKPSHEREMKRHRVDTLDEFYDILWGSNWRKIITERQLRMATEATTPVTFIGPVKDPDDEEEVERIADLIEEAYTNFAPNTGALEVSCMRYPAGNFSTNGVHPVRAYASPDLALAVMRNAKGQTLGRCICWPEKKIYNRIYSDNNALNNALKALGYERSGYYGVPASRKTFKGARMRKIEKHDYYIMPYIDGPNGVDDAGDWFTMGGSEIACERTDGRAYMKEDGPICEHCEDEMDEGDQTRVYLDSSRHNYQYWCPHCLGRNAFYCSGYDVHFSNHVDRTDVDDRTYSLRYVEDNANYCEYHGEWTFERVHTVITNENGDTQTWSQDACDDNAYEFEGDWYSDEVEARDVIIERYVQFTELRRVEGPSGRDFDFHYQATNVWYRDEVVSVPVYRIDEGDALAYEGVDGKWYMRDYVDHYPVERERVQDVNYVPPCWAFEYLEHPQPTANFGERMAELRALRELVGEDCQDVAIDDIIDIYNGLFVNE
jgi:hypothetical protein